VIRWINEGFRLLDRVLEAMLCVALAVMVAVVFANVFCRFILHFSLSWGDELALVLMVWLTFLGAALAVRDESHYAFDYLLRSLPGRARRPFAIFSQLIALAAIVCLLYWSTEVTLSIRRWVMPAMGFSRSLVYGACPVGCLFMLAYALRTLAHEIRGPAETSAAHEKGG